MTAKKKPEDKQKAGRPSKYKPEMCLTVVELMREGASKVEVCAELDICYDTFLAWQNPEHDTYVPEFLESVKRGEKLCEAWWEKKGRINLENKEFSPTLWYMNMKNRFGWKDKQELTGAGDGPLVVQVVKFGESNPSE